MIYSNNIAIQAATGVGKSKMAIDRCEKFIALGSNKKILLVVAERAHIQNWNDEFNKWNFKYPVTIICYASLKNYRDTEWDIIIFDEAHHLQSELRLEIFDSIKAKYRIFLSATLKENLIYRLEESCGKIESIKLGLQEAFDSNILPEPKIKLIPLTLNTTDYNQTIIEEWGTKFKQLKAECKYEERWKFLKDKKKIPAGKLTIKCTEYQKYSYLCNQFDYYKKRYMLTKNEAIKNKWLQIGSKRKQYLGLLKTREAYKLIKKVRDKRFICFCTDIMQADILGGKNAIHSKKKNNLSILSQFNDGKINNLYAVGMLQEGVNLRNIQVGIIIQLDGEERAFIQKFGRTLRAESPIQYILYYKNTRDEEYLNKALENIDKKYICYENIH